MDLEKVKLSDLGEVVTGKTPPTKNEEYYGEKYPFITPTDINGSERYIETERYLSDQGFDYQEKVLLPSESVCFVCIGATIGKICMTKTKSFTNQQINSIKPDTDNHDPKFIYYLLSTKGEELKKIAGGAATPIVNKSSFSDFEVEVPSLKNQNEIASILSAFDDLIENNSRRIEILEEMARRIYREWFVHFRYPGHENDKLVDSGTDLGEIPEGWEVMKLENIIELNYGKGLRKKDRVEGKYPVYGSSGVIDWHNDYQVKGPGVIVGRKGNVGSMFWEYENFNPIDTTFYVETSLPLTYAFYNLQNQNFINSDAAVPGLSKRQASTLPVLVPDKKILESFDTKILQLFELKRVLSEKNKKLKETRDLLLPKLISGKIDVEEVKV